MRIYRFEKTWYFDINKYGTLCIILDYNDYENTPFHTWMQVIPRSAKHNMNLKGMMFGINLPFNRQLIFMI